jgi:hypothetical protein
MTDNNNSTIDESRLGQIYAGKTKTIWNDKGQRVLVPDLDSNSVEAIASANSSAAASSSPYVYKKTVEDIISSTDTFQYDRLKSDADRYAFIRNMITGIDSTGKYPLFDDDIGGGGIYVERDFRSLTTIIQTLINNRKIFMDKSGNLYHYEYALDNKLIRMNCPHCSAVIDNGPDGLRLHMWSHQMRR